jgi:nitric oxide synthase oxygenase domain/subunit
MLHSELACIQVVSAVHWRSLWLACLKLTWCDNGIQSEAAVAVSGCFASCCTFNDWQLLAACLC